MHIEPGYVSDIPNINEKIDNSFNGTCFAYDWFLKLKQSEKILKIYDQKKNMVGFMPVFNSNNSRVIAQSTMYIPYGGPVIFNLLNEERNKIRFIRNVEKSLCNYLQSNYDEVNFSTDNNIIDIMPFIRANFTPEVRYTYKLDLSIGIEKIYNNFGSDRKKDIRKAKNRNVEFIVDSTMKYFDVNKAMKWEAKYGFESTADFVKKYINETINNSRGMCFVAKENDKIIGGVHIAWDSNTAYILYSYYEEEKDDIAIAYIYYKMFEYLINNDIVRYMDFEGSVFESIEDWNISFGAYQSRFYNLHWNNKDNLYLNVYDYGEK
jgi:hypothetical protein